MSRIRFVRSGELVIYLVGGPPRVGKSTVAQQVCVRHAIPWVSSDPIVQVVGAFDPTILTVDEDDVEAHAAAAWPHLRRFVLHAASCAPQFLLEGDAFLPEQVHELAAESDVRACFLGTSSVTLDQLLRNVGHNDWLLEADDHVRRNLCNWLMRRSERLAISCERFGFAYFDVAEGWKEAIAAAVDALVPLAGDDA
jgi:hypothetical protein